MSDLVTIPATGTGDATPKVSTQQVSADSSQVQDVQLASVVAGVRTRIPAGQAAMAASVPVVIASNQTAVPVSAASLPLPTGAATAAKQPALGTAGTASSDVLTVQGITSMTPLKVDGSGTTQPVSAASLPLPSGASTAAKQPALGTAGAASADVITIQGVASMTAVKVDGSGVTQPVSGTVTTTPPSNASTNVAQLAGTTTDTNSGVKSAGTLRVVIATDQPALTNALKVDASATTQPVSGTIGTKTALTGAAPTAVSVGVASGAAVASNAGRKGLVLVNTSVNSISLGLNGNAAVLNSGITIMPNGGSWEMGEYSFTTGAIAAIAGGATSNLAVQEFS